MAFDKYNGVLLQTYEAGFEEQERLFNWYQRRREAEILILVKIPSQCLIIKEIEGDEQTQQSFILIDMICSLEDNYKDIMKENGGLINQNPEFREAMNNALLTLKFSGIPITSTMEEIFKKLME